MAFTKGVSGNPTGRPKGAKGISQEIARRTNNYATILDTLEQLVATGSPREQLGAAQLLMAYGLGKPLESRQVLSMTMSASQLPLGFSHLRDQDKMQILDELRQRALTGTIEPQDDSDDHE